MNNNQNKTPSVSSSSTSSSTSPTSVVNSNESKPSPVESDLHSKSIEVGTIRETLDYENLINTSAVLHYCKCKILRPYLRLFAVMGLKSTNCSTNSDSEYGLSRYCVLANFHTFQVIVFICLGFLLQYMACFRRDRGFCCKYQQQSRFTTTPIVIDYNNNNVDINQNNGIKAPLYDQLYYENSTYLFSHLIPSVLYIIAYLYTLYLFRIKENEQLSNLMERTFLLSSSNNSSNTNRKNEQTKLVKVLWFFIGSSIIWMTLGLITVTIMMMTQGTIQFQWLIISQNSTKIVLKIFFILCTCWHDMVQSTIITSYCLQGQLLIAHLYFLKIKLLEHSLPVTDWMKDILEFKKLLKYLNDDLGPAVCIYTIVNLSWAISGIIWLLHYDKNENNILLDHNSIEQISSSTSGLGSHVNYVNIINVILWALISLCPFIQAARLTTACSTIQSIGHEVRVRPFVYQGTPGEDLDTILLYTSSLKMYAKLFRVPITGRYLCIILTISSIIILTLGQCHFFS